MEEADHVVRKEDSEPMARFLTKSGEVLLGAFDATMRPCCRAMAETPGVSKWRVSREAIEAREEELRGLFGRRLEEPGVTDGLPGWVILSERHVLVAVEMD